jgi:hypothetical protein
MLKALVRVGGLLLHYSAQLALERRLLLRERAELALQVVGRRAGHRRHLNKNLYVDKIMLMYPKKRTLSLPHGQSKRKHFEIVLGKKNAALDRVGWYENPLKILE